MALPLVRSASALAVAALLVAPVALAEESISEADRAAVLEIENARGEAARALAALRADLAASFEAAQAEALATFEAERDLAMADFDAAVADARASLESARADAAARCAESAPDARAECERDDTAEARAGAAAAVERARADAKARIEEARASFHAALDAARGDARAEFNARSAEIYAAYGPKVQELRAELERRGVTESRARAAMVAMRDPAAKAAAEGEFKLKSSIAEACTAAGAADEITVEGRSFSREACAKAAALSYASARSEANPVAACAHFMGLVKSGARSTAEGVDVAGERLDAGACATLAEAAKAPAGLVVTAALRAKCAEFAQRFREAAAADPTQALATKASDGTQLSYGACARALDSPESRAGMRGELRAKLAAGLASRGGSTGAFDPTAAAAAAKRMFDGATPEKQAAIREACAGLALSGAPSATVGPLTLTREKCAAIGLLAGVSG